MRYMLLGTLAAAAFAGVAIGGCGGENDPVEFADVVACLQERGATVSDDQLDGIAEQAGAGAVDVDFERNSATVVVERNADDAEETRRQYITVGEAFDETVGEDDYERHNNVVVGFTKTPTDEERELVEGCVSGDVADDRKTGFAAKLSEYNATIENALPASAVDRAAIISQTLEFFEEEVEAPAAAEGLADEYRRVLLRMDMIGARDDAGAVEQLRNDLAELRAITERAGAVD
jgi:hypothetical protein